MEKTERWQKHVNITIDADLYSKAKKERLNISQLTREAILKSYIQKDKTEYPLEMAAADPENYWIEPLTGACKKRGLAQYFINDSHGKIIPVAKEEYKKWYAYHVKKLKEEMAEEKKITQQDGSNAIKS